MYHGQSNGAISLPARWINERAPEALEVRDARGRRVLQEIHLRLLIMLQAKHPQPLGPVFLSDREVAGLLDCSLSSVRRIRAALVHHGLLDWSKERSDGRRELRPAGAGQAILDLEAGFDSHAESKLIPERNQMIPERNQNPSPVPPPSYTVTGGDSLLGESKIPPKESSRVGSAQAREELWPQIRERRRQVMGRSRLTEAEKDEWEALLAHSGTLLDVDEAIQVWEDDGRRSLGSFVYILRIAGKAASARNEFLTGGGAAPPPRPSAAGAAQAPGNGVCRPVRGRARRETAAEAHERCMAELGAKYGWDESRTNGVRVEGAESNGAPAR